MGGLRGRAALSWQAGLGSEVGAEQEQTAELELEPSEEEMGGGADAPPPGTVPGPLAGRVGRVRPKTFLLQQAGCWC